MVYYGGDGDDWGGREDVGRSGNYVLSGVSGWFFCVYG